MDQEVLDLGVVGQQQLREQLLHMVEVKANASCKCLTSARVLSRSSRRDDGSSRSLYLFSTPAISDVMNGSDTVAFPAVHVPLEKVARVELQGEKHTCAACVMNWYIVFCEI